MSLQPCPSCARHVRSTESICPFCAAAITMAPAAAPVIGERLGRAALFAFGAAMATNVAACGMAATPGDDAAVGNDASHAAVDAGTDAGTDAATNPDSGFFPPYGTPPPEDGGTDGGPDTGNLAGAYGAPPSP